MNHKMRQPYGGPHVSRSATAFSTAFTACSHRTCESTTPCRKEIPPLPIDPSLAICPYGVGACGNGLGKSGKWKGACTDTGRNEHRNAHRFLELGDPKNLRKNKCVMNILLQEDMLKLETIKKVETPEHQKKATRKDFNSSRQICKRPSSQVRTYIEACNASEKIVQILNFREKMINIHVHCTDEFLYISCFFVNMCTISNDSNVYI